MPAVATAIRTVRAPRRASGRQCPRRRSAAANSATFSHPEIDEESAMPTWASGVPSTNTAFSATFTAMEMSAV